MMLNMATFKELIQRTNLTLVETCAGSIGELETIIQLARQSPLIAEYIAHAVNSTEYWLEDDGELTGVATYHGPLVFSEPELRPVRPQAPRRRARRSVRAGRS